MNATTQNNGQSVIDRVKAIAEMAGFTLSKHPDCDALVCPFDMGNGRSQSVYLTHCGATPDGHDVVSFMSPCMAIEKGLMKGVSKTMALDLLRRNSNLLFAHFAIEQMPGGEILVVTSNQIVDTMEVEEFRNHILCVASIADAFEREIGRDMF
ncbi:MAG: hypothetical protein ACF8PN_12060 [Phycisphaerales bacterium]